MMWGEADLPMVSELDIDVEKDFTDNFDLETYIKQSLTEQFTMMMRDVDHRGPVMDERDFEEGGVYSNHPEVLEMNRVTKIIESGDEEEIKKLNLKEWNPNDYLDREDDDDEDE